MAKNLATLHQFLDLSDDFPLSVTKPHPRPVKPMAASPHKQAVKKERKAAIKAARKAKLAWQMAD